MSLYTVLSMGEVDDSSWLRVMNLNNSIPSIKSACPYFKDDRFERVYINSKSVRLFGYSYYGRNGDKLIV